MKKKNIWGLLFLGVLVLGTLVFLLRRQPLSGLLSALSGVRPGYVLLGLGLMFCFVGLEALCTRLILGRLGHRLPYRRCLGYSFAGFCISSITPSSTGGQPAQIFYMSRDGVPAAHGSLNMMLVAVCYQVVNLLYAMAAFFLLPDVRKDLGTGLGLLLLYGGIVTLFLTAGMLSMMFLPNCARRLTSDLVGLGVKLRLVRHEAQVREKLDRQMKEYRRGTLCLQKNLSLVAPLLVLTFLQLTALYAVPFVVYLGFGLGGASLLQMAGAQAMIAMAVGLLPLPGAVGAAEGIALRVYTLFFGAALSTPAVLVSRGISFYSFLAISAIVTLGVHFRTGRTDLVLEAEKQSPELRQKAA